jgi:repressor LexA
MLTRKQHELLLYLDQQLKKDGVSPSFEEMKKALSLKSKSGIHRLITGLEERGFIRRLPHRARAIEVIRLPDNMESLIGKDKNFKPNIIKGDFRLSGNLPDPVGDVVNLPLYGRIAAGTPIEALRNHSSNVDIPASLIGKGEHYALEVDGESMIDAGINHGDTVVICRSDTAENGSIIVALIEDTEVTLKRLRRKGDSIALEPANTSF